MTRTIGGLPVAEFGLPGELRDRLVAAILSGQKTSTSTLLADYEQDGEALEEVGDRAVVVDSAERPTAVIETTEVRVLPIREIDLAFAREEGEGSRQSPSGGRPTRASGLPTCPRCESRTLVVAERFRLVEILE